MNWLDWSRKRKSINFQNWRNWLDGSLDRPLVMIESFDPDWIKEHPDAPFRPAWDLILEDFLAGNLSKIIDWHTQQFEHAHFLGDGFPKWFPNLGAGFLAAILGSSILVSDNTAWFDVPQKGAKAQWVKSPLSEIKIQFDTDNYLWLRLLELSSLAREKFGGKITLGYTDIGGNLDILASLIGAERLSIAMIEEPNQISRLCEEIRIAWKYCFDELNQVLYDSELGISCWAAIWGNEPTYMLQSDFSYMISPKMFKRFVIPDLENLSQGMQDPFYHLDGVGQIRHLDMLLALDSLRGIQWIPGANALPPEQWLELLAKIKSAGKLCQLYVSAEGARTISQELGGSGFAFYIFENLNDEDAEKLISEISSY